MNVSTNRTIVRTRTVLDEWFVLVMVVLIALALIGGWGVYAVVADDQSDQEDVLAGTITSTTGGFDHAAVVQEENEVFSVGEELRDRSTYFTTVTPTLDGEFSYTFEATNSDVSVSIKLEHLVRSVDENDEVTYWETSETLASTTIQDADPGETHTESFSVNVSETDTKTEQIEESLGSSPGTVESLVIAEVTVQGTVDGEPVDRTDEYQLQIDPDGDVYHVYGDSHHQWTPAIDDSEDVAMSGPATYLGPIPSGILLAFSVTALLGLAATKARGKLAPSRDDLETVRTESDRETFDDWISRGSLPSSLHDRAQIETETLEDLVDLAIDCDRRVIDDGDAFYVVDGEILYRYDPTTA